MAAPLVVKEPLAVQTAIEPTVPASMWSSTTCTATIPTTTNFQYLQGYEYDNIDNPQDASGWLKPGQKITITAAQGAQKFSAFPLDSKFAAAGWSFEYGKAELKPAVLPNITAYRVCGQPLAAHMFIGGIGFDPKISVTPWDFNMGADYYTYDLLKTRALPGYYFRIQDQLGPWYLEGTSSPAAEAQPNSWLPELKECAMGPVALPFTSTHTITGTVKAGSALTANARRLEPYGVTLK